MPPLCLGTEVWNSKTRRCVSRTGKVGKDIIAAVAGGVVEEPTNPCNANEVFDAKTRRCLKANGKAARDTRAKENKVIKEISPKPPKPAKPAKSTPKIVATASTSLKKRNSNLIVEVLIHSSPSSHVVQARGTPIPRLYQQKDKVYTFKTNDVQAAMDKYSELIEIALSAQYNITKVVDKSTNNSKENNAGKRYHACNPHNPPLEPKNAIAPSEPIAKRTNSQKNNAITIDVKKCRNQKLLEEYNKDLENVEDKTLLIQISSGRCYLASELYQYIVASESLSDPMQPSVPLTQDDLHMLARHHALTPEEKIQLSFVVNKSKDMVTQLVTMMNRSPADKKTVIALCKALVLTGIICRCEYPRGEEDAFEDSYKALGMMNDIISATPPEISLAFKSLSHPRYGNNTLRDIIANSSGTCIHGVGTKLITMALHYVAKLGLWDDAISNKYFYRSRDKTQIVLAYEGYAEYWLETIVVETAQLTVLYWKLPNATLYHFQDDIAQRHVNALMEKKSEIPTMINRLFNQYAITNAGLRDVTADLEKLVNTYRKSQEPKKPKAKNTKSNKSVK